MSIELSTLIEVLTPFVLALFGWMWRTHAAKLQALSAENHEQAARLQTLEVALEGTRAKAHNASNGVEALREELNDIRDNMARKDDLRELGDGLREYITASLKFSPLPRRKR